MLNADFFRFFCLDGRWRMKERFACFRAVLRILYVGVSVDANKTLGTSPKRLEGRPWCTHAHL